jgi:hypothetical protein
LLYFSLQDASGDIEGSVKLKLDASARHADLLSQFSRKLGVHPSRLLLETEFDGSIAEAAKSSSSLKARALVLEQASHDPEEEKSIDQ